MIGAQTWFVILIQAAYVFAMTEDIARDQVGVERGAGQMVHEVKASHHGQFFQGGPSV